jgi:hypothetical protein
MIGTMDQRSKTEWAWAAGLFEGEGHIEHRQVSQGPGRKLKWKRELVLGMTDEDVVRRFHAIVGVGTVRLQRRPKDKPEWANCWIWNCSRWDETEPTLRRLLPWLGDRRGAAAKELLANPPLVQRARAGSTHCFRGHPLSGGTLYMKVNTRICRKCARASYERHRERHRERRLLRKAETGKW